MQNGRINSNGKKGTNYFPLLIVLIIIACIAVGLVLVFGAKNFSDVQRWMLIGFLIAFSVFGVLVALFGSAVSEWLTMREVRTISMTESRRNTAWNILPPDAQKHKLRAEVKKLADLMKTPDEQLSDLLSAKTVFRTRPSALIFV